MQYKNLTFKKIYYGTLRRLSRLLKLHPTSYPYLSGDTFRNLANHIHDMDSSVRPEQINDNDIVFVQSARLEEFFLKFHPQIKTAYILITHNGDENITEKYLSFIDDNIIHWFAQNCLVSHPKITPLPIGLENKWYYLHGIPSYFDRLRNKVIQKKFKILYKFNIATNPTERGLALETLAKYPFAETYTDWRESWSYLNTLNQFAFVASPVGNGEDCHRTWEAMYLGTIPIVRESVSIRYFESLKLPMWIMSDWKEIGKMTEEDLTSKYASILSNSSKQAIDVDFWEKKIIEQKTKIRQY